MQFSVADRTITLNAREFAEFTTGPIGGGRMRHDPERAKLGQVWHDELRVQTAEKHPASQFEVPFAQTVVERGWQIRIAGRIDQILRDESGPLIREIKTVTRPLPAEAAELRDTYPHYFNQLALYQVVGVAAEVTGPVPGELVFVEPATGVIQLVPQDPEQAEARYRDKLAQIHAFAEQRRSGLERLRQLRHAPAFEQLRPGQETVLADLRAASRESPVVFFEAPTGFGKTGIALEYALGELASGRLTRLIYLTGKATGQIQVVRQLEAMLGHPPAATWWQIRNKSDHCINDVYHCFRDACRFLDGQEERWPASGLSRFAQDPALPRDLDSLRAAGRNATICPYEITRATLPFTDIWIADYNYVFAPSNRSFLFDLPGFEPAHTLLVVDEAHNLPGRAAESYSTELTTREARNVVAALDFAGAPHALVAAWERLALFLNDLGKTDMLDPADEADLLELLAVIERHTPEAGIDYAALGPAICETLFQASGLHATLGNGERSLPELIWVPERGVARFTCLDAAAAIAETVAQFGHAVFLSATLSPMDVFARQCGLDRLGVEASRLVAHTPWRDEAYDVAIDARVDTRYDRRARHLGQTAAAIAAMHAHCDGPVVAFFPSYTYAEKALACLEAEHPEVRAVFQPRTRDLAERTAFIEEALALADVMILVLGSSFAEGIDMLGGRVAGVVMVGPALPEVNAVQRARVDASKAPTRSDAFREVYQIPGLQKVNQALGRLVRAPGQRARVLLHCRRFAEESYRSLLAPEYRQATMILSDDDFQAWLEGAG